jgi:Terminase small subunit
VKRPSDHIMAERRLSLKQKLFVEAYLGPAAGNATRAAELAGYAEHAVTGSKLLRKAKIRSLVEKRVTKAGMDANRVLTLMSKIAEGSPVVSDQVRALKWMGDHWGLWDVSRTDQSATEAAELARKEQAAADDEATIAELMGEHGLSREAAEDLIVDLHEAHAAELAKRSMADELKAALLGGPLWRVSHARKDEIIREVCQRHGLIEPDPEPDPPPRPALPCGFRELSPPLIRPKPAPPIEPEPPWPGEATAPIQRAPEPVVDEGEWFSPDGGETCIKIER